MRYTIRFDQVFGNTIDTDAVLDEAQRLSGSMNPSVELILALAIKAVAEKAQIQIEELKDQLFIKTKTLQELEDEGKLWGVPKPTNGESDET